MSRWRALTFVVLGLAAATAGLFAILMLGFSEGHTARLVEAAEPRLTTPSKETVR